MMKSSKVLRGTAILPVALVASLALGACSSSGGSGDEDGEVSFQFVNTVAITGGTHEEALKELPEIVAEATDGRVKLKVVDELVGPTELLSALKAGRFAGGHVFTDYVAATYPTWHVGGIPGLIEDTDDLGRIVQEVIKPAMQETVAEQADAVSMAVAIDVNQFYLTVDKPIESPDDFDGLQMRTSGAMVAKTYEANGAIPIELPFGEVYGSAERKIIDGSSTSASATNAFSLFEVMEYADMYPGGHSTNQYIFTNEFLDALTDDEREAFETAMAEFEAGLIDRYRAEFEANLQTMRDNGMTIVEPSAEAVATFQENNESVLDWYASDEFAGAEGAELIEKVRAITGR